MKFIFRFLFAAAIIITGSGFGIVCSQNITPNDIRVMKAPEAHHFCTFEHTERNAYHYVRHGDLMKKGFPQASSEFEVTYMNNCGGSQWPADAREAVELALSIWETHVQSTIPIKVRAIWVDNLPERSLGSAGPTLVAQIPEPIGVDDTWYAIAQANAMIGVDILETSPNEDHHINMRINCNFEDWYFGTDANPPENLIDLTTVVLHEVGHGIGFIGSVRADEDTEIAEWGIAANGVLPLIYDRFTEDGIQNSILNEALYPNPSNELYNAVTGEMAGVFFNGTQANRTFGGFPVPLYAPSPWEAGSSFSHVDLEIFTDSDDALMRPAIDRATAVHTPGPVMCGIFDDQGWPLGGACLDLLNIESAIVFTQTFLDFGITSVGRNINLPVQITNEITAEDPLQGRIIIDSIQFESSAEAQKFSLEPGESIEVNLRFSPANIGEHSATAMVFHNSNQRENPILIELEGEALAPGRQVALEQNFPNPFNATTRIPFALSSDANVKLEVFNSAGRRVATLIDSFQSRGRYEVDFNAGNLSSGVYYYRILVNDSQEFKSLILVK